MNNDIRIYGNGLNSDVIRDVKRLNEEIVSAQTANDKEKLLQLRMQRLYRGMELNAGLNRRTYGGYFPY